METQTTLSGSSIKIQVTEYKNYENSVGNNLQSIQITTKYRCKMMRKDLLKVDCKLAIEEACMKHKIDLKILKVLDEHVHLIVDCPRTISVAKMMQLIKGLSSYILFRLCPALKKRYPKGNFWSEGYFCVSCGSDYEKAMKYIENQEMHHVKELLRTPSTLVD
jgi:putative transposase